MLGLLNEVTQPLTEKNWEFPELFENYEEYHENVNTGKLIRARLIEDWLLPNSTVLDVGVGDGIMAEYLRKKRNLKIIGIDISNLSCEKARKLGIDTKIRDINNGLDLGKNEFYDYILLSEVIEHVMYPNKILKEAVMHSKKGVIVTIPNSGYLRWRIHLLRGYFPRQSFTHLHFWSINDFKIFCDTLEIKILKLETSSKSSMFKNLLAWQQCWLLAPGFLRNQNLEN